MNSDIESTARTLVAGGKGILAADETPGTLSNRFDALGIRSTEPSRRTHREMLFTAPDVATFVSGVISAGWLRLVSAEPTQRGSSMSGVC